MAAAPKQRDRLSPVLREADDLFDRVDVPAAVVCASCGLADCPGCEHEITRSGVVALVPWERPMQPFFPRLWLTARATTRDADRFFEGLPDGPLATAFRFAIVAELIASFAMFVAAAPIVFFLGRGWLQHVFLDAAVRDVAVRVLFASVPALALLMVTAHVVHGAALEWGARRAGARPSPVRALRFGLYSTGWDLMLGPFGLVVAAIESGPRGVLDIFGHGAGLPSRSARAFLRGIYRLDGERARGAMAASTAAAIVATLVGAVLVLGWLVYLALL